MPVQKNRLVFGVMSRKLATNDFVAEMLGVQLRYVSRFTSSRGLAGMLGWGRKRPSLKAERFAKNRGLDFYCLEDGFLRSCGLGVAGVPGLSVIKDDLGIYFDARKPSRLEVMLQHANLDEPQCDEGRRVLSVLQRQRLTKYNTGVEVPTGFFVQARDRVLVVDQTAGDASIHCGLADTTSFERMLNAAIKENPQAEIWVKTHPDVIAGKRASSLSFARGRDDIHWLIEDFHPHSLLAHFSRVYVATSQFGLDALICNTPVTCFGMPFYSGWGLTDDRVFCERRTRTRTLPELVYLAYLAYPHYLNPYTKKRGCFDDVAAFITHQNQVKQRLPARFIAVGMQYWKKRQLQSILAGVGKAPVFYRSVKTACAQPLNTKDAFLCWGRKVPAALQLHAQEQGVAVYHLEDGFYRSVGLGSDFIRPQSLVFDRQGLYFDATQASDLENWLNQADFQEKDRVRAAKLRETIITHQLTKYNLEDNAPPQWALGVPNRPVVLVPGQVEDDASIQLGCEQVRSNLALLQQARRAHPEAWVVYKPHPDVVSGNRKGAVSARDLAKLADVVETKVSVIACIQAADEVHTMTSMSGFEALIYGKRVVVYGRPFYAGWGLTEDQLPVPRRTRSLTLDELVFGALVAYPVYWDWALSAFTECEVVLDALINERNFLQNSGRFRRLTQGGFYRLLRKAKAYR